MSQASPSNDVLFEQLAKRKKRRRLKTVLIVLAIVLTLITALVVTVARLRQRVMEEFANQTPDVLTFEVTRDTLETTISASGTLEQMDLLSVEVPAGVEIIEVLVQQDDQVQEGDILAKVNMSTVLGAMSSLQTRLDELDARIADAKNDEVQPYLTAGAGGRLMELFVAEGDDIASCMMKNGSLGTLSLDGLLAVEIPLKGTSLETAQEVLVRYGEDQELKGKVELVREETAVIVFSDEKILPGTGVKVYTVPKEKEAEPALLGEGSATIHSPLSLTGFAGTVEKIYVQPGEKVSAGTDIFRLTNTSYSTNYDTLLRQRSDLEEELMDLLNLYRDGAVLSPISGLVDSVDYSEEENSSPAASSGSASLQGQMMEYASSMGAGMSGAASQLAGMTPESGGTKLLTIDPLEKMSMTVGIDENHILALKEGQKVDITISSLDGEEVFPGEVTEVIKVSFGEASISGSGLASAFMGQAASGVTEYTAKIELARTEGMLPGMSAEAGIHIEGTENVLVIPIDALHQTSSSYYVYTSFDEETGEYGGKVNVEPGMQSTKMVEILSGLEEGQTVYYVEKQEFDFFEQFYGRGRR